MYHVSLDLSPEQVKKLKQRALDRDLTVRELVTRLVVEDQKKEDKKTKT